MATKNNNRNIRISDQMLQLIEKQSGNNFTEKWEMLVIRCNWELPEKEKQLKALDEQIAQKRQQLQDLNKNIYTLQDICRELIPRAEALQRAFDRNLQKFEA